MNFRDFTIIGIIEGYTKDVLFHFVPLSAYHHNKGIAVITLLTKLVRGSPIYKTCKDKAQTTVSICLVKLFELLCAVFYYVF